MRVCMGIITTALRDKKKTPYFHSVSLAVRPLTLKKRTHFSEFSISRFSAYIRQVRKAFLWEQGEVL